VCGTARRGFQRPDDDVFNLFVSHAPRRTWPRLVIQAVQPFTHNPATPFADGGLRHAQPFRHACVVMPFGAREDDPGAAREVWRGTRTMSQRIQSHAFVVR